MDWPRIEPPPPPTVRGLVTARAMAQHFDLLNDENVHVFARMHNIKALCELEYRETTKMSTTYGSTYS